MVAAGATVSGPLEIPPAALPISVRHGGSSMDAGGWSSIIGIVTAIVGNVLISFALNTQRYAHIRLARELHEQEGTRLTRPKTSPRSEDADPERADRRPTAPREAAETDALLPSPPSTHDSDDVEAHRPRDGRAWWPTATARDERDEPSVLKQRSYLRSPYWWIGIALMTTGEAGNFLAYGFAPASIVSPLGVVALISNCIVAPFMLKEPFRTRDFLGVIIAVAGAVTVVLSANDSNPKLGPDEIWSLISTWEFETYLGITIFLIIALMAASRKYGERSIFIDLGLVGLFGGYTALSTKGVASLLSYTLFKALAFPITYLLVAVLVATAILQIKYVNRALQRFDATQVIPIQFVLFTLSVILGSAILYRDFETTTASDAGKFIGGCAMTFVGVWLITSARELPDEEEERRESGPLATQSMNVVNGERYRDDFRINTPSRRSSIAVSRVDPEASAEAIRRRSSDVQVDGISSAPETPSVLPSPQLATPKTPTMVNMPPHHLQHAAASYPSTLLDSPALTSNPWEQPDYVEEPPPARPPTSPPPSKPPPILKTANSAPVLPTDAQIIIPPPSDQRKQIHMGHSPTTPSGMHPEAVTPSATTSRNSVAGILPGPLTAPLSSSLSAIVADSLRRGVNITPIRRKPRSYSRATPGGGTLPTRPTRGAGPSSQCRSGSVADLGDTVAFPGTPTPAPRQSRAGSTQNGPNGDSGESVRQMTSARRKSIGGTLGGLFKGRRRRANTTGENRSNP